MLTDPEALIAGFCEAADGAGIEGWPCPVRFETLPAPHDRPSLPPDEAAVYAFTLSAVAGHSAPCGPGTVLMVGKARANNDPHVRDALAVYVRGTAGSVFHRASGSGARRSSRRAAYHQAMPGVWA